MQKPNPDHPVLTKNDQEVLKKIISHAKLPDAEIAKEMGLSPQAVFKIRKKLEEKGIIEGYQPTINFRKLGISVMALVIVRITPEVWANTTDALISERIRQIPYVIDCYRVLEADASHIMLLGFRNVEQIDKYLAKLQTTFSREIELKGIYPFSIDKVITRSPVGLLYEILDKKEFPMEEFFIRKKS